MTTSSTARAPGPQRGEAISLIGSSPAMDELRRQISTAAVYDEPVLILGETGTGKELVARSIHAQSKRHPRRFRAFNCGAIHGDLLLSELFGHETGAFTGACKARKGLIRDADGSTLLLDEVSETSAAFQVALLRTLDQGEVQPLGHEGRADRVNVRFIAASNRIRSQLQDSEGFRHDLFYRLACFLIFVPPVRERPEDIRALAHHFLSEFREKYGGSWTFSGAAIALLEDYDYPGNVRELRQIVFSSCCNSRSSTITGHCINDALTHRALGQSTHPAGAMTGRDLALQKLVSSHIRRAVLIAEGNLSGAAEMLDVPRSTLQHMIDRHGIDLVRLRETARQPGGASHLG